MPVKGKFLRPIFAKIILSHVSVVLAVSVLIALLNNSYFTQIMQKQIFSAEREILTRISGSVRMQALQYAETLWAENITNNYSMTEFFAENKNRSIMNIVNLQKELADIKGKNPELIDKVDIYSKSRNIYVSSADVVKFMKDGDLSPIKELEENVSSGEIKNEWILTDSDGEKNITLYRTFPYVQSGGTKFRGFFAIHLKEKAVADIVRGEIIEPNKNIYLVNKDGTVYSDISGGKLSGSKYANAEVIKKAEKNNEAYSYMTVGKRMVFAQKTSDNGLWLVEEVNASVLFGKLQRMHIYVVAICILFIIVGSVISLFMCIKIYEPLNNIINNIKHMISDESLSGRDEYKIIDSTLNILNTKINTLESTLSANEGVIRNNYISSILTDGNAYIKRESGKIGAKLGRPYFTAIDVSITAGQMKGLDIKNQEYFLYDLIEHIENTGNDNTSCTAAVVGVSRAGILINSDSAADGYIKSVAESIRRFSAEKHNIDAVISIGSTETGINNVYISYRNAKICCQKYGFLYPNRRIFFFEDYKERNFKEIEFDRELIKTLSASLKSGDADGIRSALAALTEEILKLECSYVDYEKRINEIIGVIYKYMIEQSGADGEIYVKNPYAEMRKLTNIAEAEKYLGNTAVNFIADRKERNKISNSEIIIAALKYIEDNLGNELSLTILGEKLFITPQYLSKIFKEETGVNFNAYITELRLQKAKSLLTETNWSINKIAENAGFGSANYLIKKFRERFGDTPVNYKKKYFVTKLK